MSSYKSGFRADHASALLKVSDDILSGNKKVIILLLHDFSKAFDSVDYDLLCDKLKHQIHFSRFAIDLRRSYMVPVERFQCYNISGHCLHFFRFLLEPLRVHC